MKRWRQTKPLKHSKNEVIKKMKVGKAPGQNQITADMIKAGEEQIADNRHTKNNHKQDIEYRESTRRLENRDNNTNNIKKDTKTVTIIEGLPS
jgi:hypothetical protein